jgi:hypothetical protein
MASSHSGHRRDTEGSYGHTMRNGVRRVVPLTFGWENLPKAVSVFGADPALRIRCPVPGVLCEVDGGWILLDTGFNPASCGTRR